MSIQTDNVQRIGYNGAASILYQKLCHAVDSASHIQAYYLVMSLRNVTKNLLCNSFLYRLILQFPNAHGVIIKFFCQGNAPMSAGHHSLVLHLYQILAKGLIRDLQLRKKLADPDLLLADQHLQNSIPSSY